MPVMYRPKGVTRPFPTFAEGERQGFYRSFNDMAQAQKKKADPVEVEIPEVPPEPPSAEDTEVKADAPQPPILPGDDLPIERIRELAEELGLDSKMHHTKLRPLVMAQLDEPE